jgi:hypothetical protein
VWKIKKEKKTGMKRDELLSILSKTMDERNLMNFTLGIEIFHM